jgi:hypothetical protein
MFSDLQQQNSGETGDYGTLTCFLCSPFKEKYTFILPVNSYGCDWTVTYPNPQAEVLFPQNDGILGWGLQRR